MKFLFLFLTSLLYTYLLSGQHHPAHHNHSDSLMAQPATKDSLIYMSSAFSKKLPMNVNSSGTSWLPRNSPMYMNMFHKREWTFMLHYGIFFTFTNQNVNRASRQRGNSAFYAPNWIMPMVNKMVGKKGLLMFRTMLSLDPLTVGGQGYPLLFQTGESWKQKPLIDHQHPHDFISELAIGYIHSVNSHSDIYIYAGMPGEPSIGPPVFMHRPSALNFPTSPIGHHWQDATHITFGVATIGFRYRYIKLEGSSFTGREPNENRYNFDKPKFDSYSARISFLPSKSLAVQTSYAYLNSPESLSPEKNIEKYSASILHNYLLPKDKVISTSIVWGLNKFIDVEGNSFSHSFLMESNLQTRYYSWFVRMEYIQKDNHELVIDSEDHNQIHDIGMLALGVSRYILKSEYIWLDLGLIGTTYVFSKELKPYYGNNPYSIQFFIRMIPSRMKM